MDGVGSDWRGLFATLSPTAFNMQLRMQTPRIFSVSYADTHIIISDKAMLDFKANMHASDKERIEEKNIQHKTLCFI